MPKKEQLKVYYHYIKTDLQTLDKIYDIVFEELDKEIEQQNAKLTPLTRATTPKTPAGGSK